MDRLNLNPPFPGEAMTRFYDPDCQNEKPQEPQIQPLATGVKAI